MAKQALELLTQCLLLLIAIYGISCSSGEGEKGEKGIEIFKVEFEHVQTPFIVCVWVLFASLAKIAFHHSEFISNYIPESCLLIAIGIPIGFLVKYAEFYEADHNFLTSNLFFIYLLPPIILDAGYFMPSGVFYYNIGTILMYAVLGTVFNSFAVGLSLAGVAGICNFDLTILKALLFGSLISAVDPVAVLAVFEEVHVHEVLYMLVFGESVLNDAASVVLYRTMEGLDGAEINAAQVGLAFASFFYVSIGGFLIGVIFALMISFVTKFTEHVAVIEPAIVLLMAYLSYLTAEIFEFSGIVSILFCGIVMKPYVEANVSRKSHTTIKYFLKLLSSSADSIIFMFFGISLVTLLKPEFFNWAFICFTLLFITVFRAISVVVLTFIANKFGRLEKVKKVEQFIMVYGGLRGAVAFVLAIVLKDTNELRKNRLITTTICVVLFTTVLQGATIKKLVEWLGVKTQSKEEKSMFQTLNERAMGYVTAGVENIIGVRRHAHLMIKLEDWNKRYFRQFFARDPGLMMDEHILATQRKIAFKTAMNDAENPAKLFGKETDLVQMSQAKENASVALELAMRAQESSAQEYGMLDMNILSGYTVSQRELYDMSDAFNPHTIASMIPKVNRQKKRTYSLRKYTMDSINESNGDGLDEKYLRVRTNVQSHAAPHELKKVSRNQNDRRQKKLRNRHDNSGHSIKPDMDTVLEVTEQDETVTDVRLNSGQPTRNNRVDKFGKQNPGYSSKDNSSDGIDKPGVNDSNHVTSDDEHLIVNNQFISTLPQPSDTPVLFHMNNLSKNISQKGRGEARDPADWQSFSISVDDTSNENKDVAIGIKEQWEEGPPPYDKLDKLNKQRHNK